MSEKKEEERAVPTPEPAPTPTPQAINPEPAAIPEEEPVADEPASPLMKEQKAAPEAPKKVPLPPVVAEEAPAPAPAEAPAAPQPVAQGQQTVAQMAQEMNDHDLQFQMDLAQGHIQPQSYHDLYAKKDTLGKLGTLFGLLIGGAGSGLTHQPNALLGMMDKEIDRDLQAQIQSNQNAQNWFRLNQAHELQKYQQAESMAKIGATQAQTYEHAAAGDFTRAKLGQLPGADVSASTAAKNQMLLGAGQYLQDMTNRLPPGPSRMAGQTTLDNKIKPAIQAKVMENNSQAAAKKKLLEAVSTKNTKTTAPQQRSAIDYDKLNKLVEDGRIKTSLGMAPKLSDGDLSHVREEAKQIEENRVVAEKYNHAFTKLNKAFRGGILNPEMVKAEIATLQAEVARATAGRFNLTEADKQAGGMFPSPTDWGDARQEKYNNAMKYFMGREAGTPTLNQFKLKTDFPKYPSPFEEKKEVAGPKEGATGTHNNKPVIFKKGKWSYK